MNIHCLPQFSVFAVQTNTILKCFIFPCNSQHNAIECFFFNLHVFFFFNVEIFMYYLLRSYFSPVLYTSHVMSCSCMYLFFTCDTFQYTINYLFPPLTYLFYILYLSFYLFYTYMYLFKTWKTFQFTRM